MLYTCQHLCGGHLEESPGAYKIAHKNHPMTKWVRAGRANYKFTHKLAIELVREFEYRYGHGHKCSKHLEWLAAAPPDLETRVGLTPVPPCMPDEYKIPGDPVESYRNYYIGSKRDIAKWTKGRPQPKWFI